MTSENRPKTAPPNQYQEPSLDLAQGYSIRLDVLPDGFRVSDAEPLAPEPLAPEPQEPEENPEPVLPDLTSALKHVLAVYQQNPVGPSADQQLEAGYRESESPDLAGQEPAL